MTGAAGEYASALWALAVEEGLTERISDELATLRESIVGAPEYIELLASPSIPTAERLATLDRVFAGSLHEYTISFVKLLCERGRIRELPDCIDEYERLHAFALGISTALVKSAVPLSDDECESLRVGLEKRLGHRLRLECVTDSSLLGGVIVQVDGKVIDGSLRHRLSEVRETILSES